MYSLETTKQAKYTRPYHYVVCETVCTPVCWSENLTLIDTKYKIHKRSRRSKLWLFLHMDVPMSREDTTAWMQEAERLRRQSRAVRSDSIR